MARSAAGTRSAVAVVTGVVNLVKNPKFATATTGWSASGVGTTLTQNATASPPIGTTSCTVHTTAAGRGALFQVGAIKASTQYVVSAYVKGTPGDVVSISLADNESGQLNGTSSNVTLTAAFQRIQMAATGGVATATGYIFVGRVSGSADYEVTLCQFETGATASAYVDGDQGIGYEWTGVPNNSISFLRANTTRSAAGTRTSASTRSVA